MDYVAIFHANLNYAFLEPFFFERTIRASYETIIDVFREKCPKAKYVFEASGYTVEHIAKVTPDVLEKLKDAIASGQCEFMGAPYSHPIMANIPEEDGRWSNEFSMRIYEEYLGMRPESSWNPECTWRQYVPRTFRDAGYKYLTLDFESYKTCTDKEYGWVERNRAHDIYWGGHLPSYDLDPDDPALHKPFRDVVPGLHGMCRSDRLAGRSIGYFLGKVPLADYLANVKKWSGTKSNDSLIIVADDAEYCGTRGYYDIKHYGDYSKCFGIVPEAGERLEAMVKGVCEMGPMITFREACEKDAMDERFFVEDGFAWHRTYAEVWGNTPEANRFDPQVDMIREEYKTKVQAAAEGSDRYKEQVERFWLHLTNAANSDGRWPPPPRKTSQHHRDWVEREIAKAREALDELKQAVS
jgi:glycosyl hydrolase family 57